MNGTRHIIDLNLTFESSPSKLKDTLKTVIGSLRNHLPDITEEDLFDLRVVYGELLANAVIHGNKNDFSKKIDMRISVNEDLISTVIRDEGSGFDYRDTLDRENTALNFADENGRGLRIVSSLLDYMAFNESGNEIEFEKKLSA